MRSQPIEAAIALLREIQWCTVDMYNEPCCPSCGGVGYSDDTGIHYRGCRLAAIIGAECETLTYEEAKEAKKREELDAAIADAEARVTQLKELARK